MVQETGLVDPIDMRRVRQPAGKSRFRRDIDEDAQIGIGVLYGKGLDRLEIHQRKLVSASLVGQRRIDEPVGNHDFAALDRRSNELGDMLRASGAVQKRLGTWLEVAQVA